MTESGKDFVHREPEGEGPESGRRVRGKPGTEAAKEGARDRQREGGSGRRQSTPPDPGAEPDESGVEKELDEPFRESDG